MRLLGIFCLFVCCAQIGSAETLRVATYNVRNYLVTDRITSDGWRPDYPKPEVEKAAVRAAILEVKPDVLLLQEMGPLPFLHELQADLATEGLSYPYVYLAEGNDANRHLAVLSMIEPVEAMVHADMDFNYFDERVQVKRGLMELVFESPEGEVFKLFNLHLKSRWSDVDADPESSIRRTNEAEAYRDRLIERTYDIGVDRFLVAGDFNDSPGSGAYRRFESRGDLQIATRVTAKDSRGEVWTHFYNRLAVYSLIDNFFVSPAWLPAVIEDSAKVYDKDIELIGSDHRMVYLDLEW